MTLGRDGGMDDDARCGSYSANHDECGDGDGSAGKCCGYSNQDELWRGGGGQAADLYTIKNDELVVNVTNFGARIVSLKTKDRYGRVGDVALGYESVSGYSAEKSKTYFGAIVGRYGNRIRGGSFTLDGQTYQIPVNNAPNALHGGPHGFDDQMWTAALFPMAWRWTLVSKDGDMDFPGR